MSERVVKSKSQQKRLETQGVWVVTYDSWLRYKGFTVRASQVPAEEVYTAVVERDQLRAEVERLKAARPDRKEVDRLLGLYISAVDRHNSCTDHRGWVSDFKRLRAWRKETHKAECDRLQALLDYVCGPEVPDE